MAPFKEKPNDTVKGTAVLLILLCVSESCVGFIRESTDEKRFLPDRRQPSPKNEPRNANNIQREILEISPYMRDVRADSRQSRIDARDIRTDFQEIRTELPDSKESDRRISRSNRNNHNYSQRQIMRQLNRERNYRSTDRISRSVEQSRNREYRFEDRNSVERIRVQPESRKYRDSHNIRLERNAFRGSIEQPDIKEVNEVIFQRSAKLSQDREQRSRDRTHQRAVGQTRNTLVDSIKRKYDDRIQFLRSAQRLQAREGRLLINETPLQRSVRQSLNRERPSTTIVQRLSEQPEMKEHQRFAERVLMNQIRLQRSDNKPETRERHSLNRNSVKTRERHSMSRNSMERLQFQDHIENQFQTSSKIDRFIDGKNMDRIQNERSFERRSMERDPIETTEQIQTRKHLADKLSRNGIQFRRHFDELRYSKKTISSQRSNRDRQTAELERKAQRLSGTRRELTEERTRDLNQRQSNNSRDKSRTAKVLDSSRRNLRVITRASDRKDNSRYLDRRGNDEKFERLLSREDSRRGRVNEMTRFGRLHRKQKDPATEFTRVDRSREDSRVDWIRSLRYSPKPICKDRERAQRIDNGSRLESSAVRHSRSLHQKDQSIPGSEDTSNFIINIIQTILLIALFGEMVAKTSKTKSGLWTSWRSVLLKEKVY